MDALLIRALSIERPVEAIRVEESKSTHGKWHQSLLQQNKQNKKTTFKRELVMKFFSPSKPFAGASETISFEWQVLCIAKIDAALREKQLDAGYPESPK